MPLSLSVLCRAPRRLRSASPLRLDEISAPSGGPWGSTYIDQQFERFVEDLIGTHNWVPYKKTSFWIDLLEAWEDIKVGLERTPTAALCKHPMVPAHLATADVVRPERERVSLAQHVLGARGHRRDEAERPGRRVQLAAWRGA